MEENQIDELIEGMKTKKFEDGAPQIRHIMEIIERTPHFRRKHDLLDVLVNRYNEVLDKEASEWYEKHFGSEG